MIARMLAIFAIGATAGLLSGVFGIGGGIIIVPALVLLFSFKPEAAVATSLGALLLPVGIFAALEYHRHALVDWRAAAALAVGMTITSWFGAKLVAAAPAGVWLPKAFGVLLIVVGFRFLFKS
jgi:uncharacterized membrane protein YfcA